MEALKVIQGKLKAPKNQFNKFGGYKYRSCEDILEAVKPLLKETGSQLTITDEITAVGARIYVKATATITDGAETVAVSAYAREAETKKGMDDSQITGTASSYARKYALNGLFLIDDNADADTEAYSRHDEPEAVKTVKKVFDGKTVNKGGDTTPEEHAELNKLVKSKYPNGEPVFSNEEIKRYVESRAELTAQELIDKVKKDLADRIAGEQ